MNNMTPPTTNANSNPFETVFAVQLSFKNSERVIAIAEEHKVKVAVSIIGCKNGNIGFYAEFDNNIHKEVFLDTIEGLYNPKEVWTQMQIPAKVISELNDNLFACPVRQEYLPKVLETIKKMTDKRDMSSKISFTGCVPGYVGLYAEFPNNSKKKKFLRKIHEEYDHNLAWIG